MSSIATLNGVQYTIPAYNDTGWAQGTGNLSLYLAAIAANTLQPTGGSFTLTADVDFGANFGLKATYLKSRTANIAASGILRLASADAIAFRNNANSGDILLSKDSSDNLLFNSNKVYIAGGAAGIVNADIASAAAIALSKLATLNTNRAVVTDGSGLMSASTTTAAEIAFVSGVTSAIQTQLAARLLLTGGTLTGGLTLSGDSLGLIVADTGTSYSYSNYRSNGILHRTTIGQERSAGGALFTGSTAYAGVTGTSTADAFEIFTNDTRRIGIASGGTVTSYGQLIAQGTVAADNAAAGMIGEVKSSSVLRSSPVSLTTATGANVTSLSLTAGDWDVRVAVGFKTGTSTSITDFESALSTTSATLPSGDTEAVPDAAGQFRVSMQLVNSPILPGTGNDYPLPMFVTRVNISSTTTYYVVAQAAFTAGGLNAYGSIVARRMR